MLRRILVVSILLMSVNYLFANDYKKVDRYARSVHKTGSYKDLAKKLTAPFARQEDKVRSIFIWITHNVKYDYRKFKSNQRKGGYRIKGRSKREIAIKRKKIKERKIATTYRTCKGVCEDYSYLFQSMCKAVGIKASYITGVTRTNPGQIGKFPKYSSHAWNAVKLNGKWFLLDATWAAGYVDYRKGRYHRDYHEGYFLTSPEIFVLNHFPDNKKWQLLTKPLSKKQFMNLPFPYEEFFKNKNILDFTPKSGFLSAKKKYSTIRIKYKGKVPDIVIYKRGKLIKTKRSILNNEIVLQIPTYARYHRNVVLAVKKGRKIKPLLEYKIR